MSGRVPFDNETSAKEFGDGKGDVFVGVASSGGGRRGGSGRRHTGTQAKKEFRLRKESSLPGRPAAGRRGEMGRECGTASAEGSEVSTDVPRRAEGRAGEVDGGVREGGASR